MARDPSRSAQVKEAIAQMSAEERERLVKALAQALIEELHEKERIERSRRLER